MNTPLVVITRPVAKQAETVRLFSEAGLSTLSLPMMTTEIQNTEDNLQQLQQAQSADVLIFPSAPAVDACFSIFPSFTPQQSSTVITVGPATKDHWADFSAHKAHVPQNHNSEGVLEELKRFDSIQQLYLISAPQGRGLIQAYCHEHNIPCKEIYVYKRVLLKPSSEQMRQLQNASSLVLTFTSLTAFQQYQENTTAMSKVDTVVVCASKRIAEEVKASGYADVLTAASASDRDILTVVEQVIESR